MLVYATYASISVKLAKMLQKRFHLLTNFSENKYLHIFEMEIFIIAAKHIHDLCMKRDTSFHPLSNLFNMF